MPEPCGRPSLNECGSFDNAPDTRCVICNQRSNSPICFTCYRLRHYSFTLGCAVDDRGTITTKHEYREDST